MPVGAACSLGNITWESRGRRNFSLIGELDNQSLLTVIRGVG